MKTIQISVYEFDELPSDIQQKLIREYRDKILDTQYIYDEAHNSVQEFNKIFNLRSGHDSWLNTYHNFDNDILKLQGGRLQRYIWNNYRSKLFKGKYYSVKSKKPVHHKRVESITCKNGNVFNAYHSAINFDNDCVLTGVCYDNDLLNPIYDFLDKKPIEVQNVNIVDLIEDCFESLRKSLENEEENLRSDENIVECLKSNDEYYIIEGDIIYK